MPTLPTRRRKGRKAPGSRASKPSKNRRADEMMEAGVGALLDQVKGRTSNRKPRKTIAGTKNF